MIETISAGVVLALLVELRVQLRKLQKQLDRHCAQCDHVTQR